MLVHLKSRRPLLRKSCFIALLAAACTTAEQPPETADRSAATGETPEGGIDVLDPEAGVQTGQQLIGPQLPPAPETPGHSCASSERVPALDEQTTLGASPSEMLRWIVGKHREKLAWQQPSGELVVDPALSELEIIVEPPTAVHLLVSNSEDPSAGFCEQVIPYYGDILTTFDELRFDVRFYRAVSSG